MSPCATKLTCHKQTVCVCQLRICLRNWETSGSCHLRTTALPFLICRRELARVPVNHSRLRRVASFQSKVVAVGQQTGKTSLYQHGICWIPCSGRVLPAKNAEGRAAAQGAHITKLGNVGANDPRATGRRARRCVWAADIFPIEALSASAASNPKVCTGFGILFATKL